MRKHKLITAIQEASVSGMIQCNQQQCEKCVDAVINATGCVWKQDGILIEINEGATAKLSEIPNIEVKHDCFPESKRDIVEVQLIEGKPVVSVRSFDNMPQKETTELAHKILRLL